MRAVKDPLRGKVHRVRGKGKDWVRAFCGILYLEWENVSYEATPEEDRCQRCVQYTEGKS